MRFSMLVAVSALSLSLAACSSNDVEPYGDELFPNEQANMDGYDQSVPSVPVHGYDQQGMN